MKWTQLNGDVHLNEWLSLLNRFRFKRDLLSKRITWKLHETLIVIPTNSLEVSRPSNDIWPNIFCLNRKFALLFNLINLQKKILTLFSGDFETSSIIWNIFKFMWSNLNKNKQNYFIIVTKWNRFISIEVAVFYFRHFCRLRNSKQII